jgi:uncharacterized protein
MGDNKGYLSFSERSPVVQLGISFLIVSASGMAIMTALSIAGIALFGVDIHLLDGFNLSAGKNEIAFLRYLLIVQQVSLFIIPGLIIRYLMKPSLPGIKNDLSLPSAGDVILVVILAFTLFPITSFTGRLNSEMNLPQWLSGVDTWINEKEDSIGQLLDSLMKQNSAGMMALNLIVIAILPALGEELIFRGVLQKILSNVFRKRYLSVWITAFFFSFVHFQFFGFLPRLILGLAFGYLYFWSGSLWLPIIAHFVNNAVPTIGAYLYGWETYNTDSGALTGKDLFGLILPLTITIVILALIRSRCKASDATIQ